MRKLTFIAGFFDALTILLITLKLLGKIDWSWILVTSTFWAPLISYLLYRFTLDMLEDEHDIS